jgi:hypothetical protein
MFNQVLGSLDISNFYFSPSPTFLYIFRMLWITDPSYLSVISSSLSRFDFTFPYILGLFYSSLLTFKSESFLDRNFVDFLTTFTTSSFSCITSCSSTSSIDSSSTGVASWLTSASTIVSTYSYLIFSSFCSFFLKRESKRPKFLCCTERSILC